MYVEVFVAKPLPVANLTPSALFRCITQFEPTLLIDEADVWLGHSEELRGLINASHTKDDSYIPRVNPDNLKLESFCVWCPKLICGIGDLHTTLQDRSIVIRLDRKPTSVRLVRIRSNREALGSVGRKLARGAADCQGGIDTTGADIPDQLNDRASDNWVSLLAIADLAGGTWPELARQVALALNGEDTGEVEAHVRLLSAIRDLLPELPADRVIPSEVLLDRLHAIDEWREYGRLNKPISAKALSILLGRFGIKPVWTRIQGQAIRGYPREPIELAIQRYVPPVEPTCNTSEPDRNTSCNGSEATMCCNAKPETLGTYGEMQRVQHMQHIVLDGERVVASGTVSGLFSTQGATPNWPDGWELPAGFDPAGYTIFRYRPGPCPACDKTTVFVHYVNPVNKRAEWACSACLGKEAIAAA